MSKHPRLQKRGSRFYLRVKVPAELRAIIGKREIREALETSDHRIALDRVRVKSCEVDAQFARARRKLQVLGAGGLQRVANFATDDWDHTAPNGLSLGRLSDAEIRDLVRQLLWDWEVAGAEHSRAVPIDAIDQALDDVDVQEENESRQNDGYSPEVSAAVLRLLKARNISFDVGSREFQLLLQLVHRATLESIRRSRDRLTVGSASRSFDPLFDEVSADRPGPGERRVSLTLGKLIEEFQRDPGRADRREKTHAAYKIVFRLLKEVIGPDKLVRQITRDDARRVRHALLVLPPNAAKRFRGLSLLQAAEKAKSEGLTALHPKTARNHLNNMAALFNWAVAEQYMEKSPADRLKLPAAGPKRKAREPFSIGQLNLIFDAPLYRCCQDDARGYSEPGLARPRRGRFWVPLLSLWGGLRLNEACQLLVSDVRVVDGVDVIIIQEDEEGQKRVKSDAGERLVPVHPELLHIGFVAHVASMREAKELRVFPDLPRGETGYYSDPFQKWFGRFLTDLGAKLPKTSFHSFRHNFRDALRQAAIPIEVVRALGGWAAGRSSEEIYGNGYRPAALAAELAKLSYEGLDLSHLYRDSTAITDVGREG